MAVSTAQIRVEIGDESRPNVPLSGPPEVMSSSADGRTAFFYMRFPKVVAGSIRVYLGTLDPAHPAQPDWINIASNDATNPWTTGSDSFGFYVQFTGQTPPPGRMVGVRYAFTAFSDTDIAQYTGAARENDQRTLMQIHVNMIPAIISNKDAMTIMRNGDLVRDTSVWQRNQMQMLTDFSKLLVTEPLDTAAAIGSSGYYYDTGPKR